MPIPLSQLETWSNQGPSDSSSRTYSSIKSALESQSSPIGSMISAGKVQVYLQGSYRNDTNTRGDSDVDIIVHYTNSFHSNKHSLPPEQLSLHEIWHDKATYTWHLFRNDVVTALIQYYGQALIDATGNKSIKVLPSSNRLRADVVPVVSYRKYQYFLSLEECPHVHGVAFHHNGSNRLIVNYPKQHYDNGVDKHKDTDNQFKRIVRIAKNARARLIDVGLLDKDVAPSYFIQSLFYNVPPSLFKIGNFDEVFPAILTYLNGANLNDWKCQNGITPLFGLSEEEWNIENAQRTVSSLKWLWDNWYTF